MIGFIRAFYRLNFFCTFVLEAFSIYFLFSRGGGGDLLLLLPPPAAPIYGNNANMYVSVNMGAIYML